MNEISLNQYFLDNSNSIIDNSSIIIIDNCRNSLDFLTKLKFEDSGVYQFNNTKARFKFKIDMLYSDPSNVTIDNSSVINSVVNNNNITRNEDFIITSLDNNIHIVTDITNDKKIQLWGNVVVNDELKVYNDASFIKNVNFKEPVTFQTNVSINNILEVSNNLLVLGDASINNSLEVSNNLLVLGDASINNILEVSNNLLVNGDALINNLLEVSNNLLVLGDASINNMLEVSNNLLVLGNSQINGDLDVSGVSTMSFVNISDGNIDNTSIGLTSAASAKFTNILGSQLEISGISTMSYLNVNDDASFNGYEVEFNSNSKFNHDVEFNKCEISLIQTTIDGSNSTIENTAIGSSHPNTGTFTNILGSHLDISSIKVYDLSNDVGISNLQFLKINMDNSNVCYGNIDLSNIFNELDNKINESNENAGLILDPSNITISNELIVNRDASFNGDVKISNGRLYFY